MKELIPGLIDLLFPPRCTGCDVVIDSPVILNFCPTCFNEVRRVLSPLCSVCGMPFPVQEGEDHPCGDCLVAAPPYTIARSWAIYESVIIKAVHQFKYQGMTWWGKMLGRAMAEAVYPGFEFSDYSLIIPVPLHRRKLRERGFNQAVLLARTIAAKRLLPLDITSLARSTYTGEQTKLGREERDKNVQGAFTLRDRSRVRGERVILVDDVYTTGSTVRECSRVLLDGGAEVVVVLTAARAA